MATAVVTFFTGNMA